MPPKRRSSHSDPDGGQKSPPPSNKKRKHAPDTTEEDAASGSTAQGTESEDTAFNTGSFEAICEYMASRRSGQVVPTAGEIGMMLNYITEEEDKAQVVRDLREAAETCSIGRTRMTLSTKKRMCLLAGRYEESATAEEKIKRVLGTPNLAERNRTIAEYVEAKASADLKATCTSARLFPTDAITLMEPDLAQFAQRGLSFDLKDIEELLATIQNIRNLLLKDPLQDVYKKEEVKLKAKVVDRLTEIVRNIRELKAHNATFAETSIESATGEEIALHRQRALKVVADINKLKAQFREKYPEKEALVGEDLLTPHQWMIAHADAEVAGTAEKEGKVVVGN